MPKVSIIIPTHNRARLLRAAMDSVLRQAFQDFEIIVVDDASQDQSEEVVRSFADPRIRYLRHATNKGQGASRNAGIQYASGEYIALLDDDDEWLPHKLEKQVQRLDDSPAKIGLVYTGFCKVAGPDKRVIAQVLPEKRGSLFEDMCFRNWIGTCSTVLLRRSCFEKIGWFDETLPSGVDYDMWLRLAKQFDIDCIREPLVLYTVHPHSISTNYETRIRGAEAQFRKYGSFFAKNRKGYSRRYLSLGVHYCYQGDLTKGREAFRKGIQLNPLEVRHYFNFCLSLFGAGTFRKFKQFKESRFAFRA
ncbi:MAG: glycosyltransferase family 2 protein [Candidatus Binatia bacterium]